MLSHCSHYRHGKYREKDEAGSAAADLARKCVPKMGIERTNNYIFIKERSVPYMGFGLIYSQGTQRSDYDARGPDHK